MGCFMARLSLSRGPHRAGAPAEGVARPRGAWVRAAAHRPGGRAPGSSPVWPSTTGPRRATMDSTWGRARWLPTGQRGEGSPQARIVVADQAVQVGHVALVAHVRRQLQDLGLEAGGAQGLIGALGACAACLITVV